MSISFTALVTTCSSSVKTTKKNTIMNRTPLADQQRINVTSCSPASTTGSRSLLSMTPRDVLVKEVLEYLKEGSVKSFLDCCNAEMLSQLDPYYCRIHGTKLEANIRYYHHRQDSFQIYSKRTCPQCFANFHKLKRCENCRKLYPVGSHKSLGLWCQKCDRMAFCNECLASPEPCTHTKLAKCVQCCSNVFTNTICGEFLCEDCGNADQLQECGVCGKATCLDSNCLVCADFRLLNESLNSHEQQSDDHLWINSMLLLLLLCWWYQKLILEK